MERTRIHVFHAMIVLAVAALALGGGARGAAAGDLVFSGDDTFGGPHGGQAITVAVVDMGSGTVVATQAGTVSPTDDPAFSFTFPGVLEDGKSYEVDYWIDSNFGGGTEGVCDPKANDHQWRVPLGTASGNVSHTEEHRPGETSDVCDTFM